MNPSAKIRHRRSGRSEEGAVMLVVMLILLIATTMASVSLQATQYELRSAGYSRSALQTQYVSEAAMTTTMAWVDAISLDRSILTHLGTWNLATEQVKMEQFGEPTLTSVNKADATRTQWKQQAGLTGVTMPPITAPGASGDVLGTFGPRMAYHPGVEDPDEDDETISDYVVDMYDCRRLTGTGSPGMQVNQGGSGTIREMQLSCVVTARGRSFVWGGDTKTWTTAAGNDYLVNRHAMAHDSRGTIVSPPIIIQ